MITRKSGSVAFLLATLLTLLVASLSSCGGSVVGAPCEDGFEHCPDGCVDLRDDERNCGRCGQTCEDGQTCWNRTCLDCDDQPGTVLCGGECVDIGSDTANCGLCGNVCEEGVPCRNGRCEACPGDLFLCSSECVDMYYDEDNCGSCGNVCLPDEECRAGQCLPPCEPPRVLCEQDCVDLASSASHCGSCDRECSGPDPVCVKGRCAETCPDWMAQCDGDCVDTYYDPYNCGACDVICPGSNPMCVAGICVKGCELPLEQCNRQCVDTASDPDHCGGCDQPCELDQFCAGGECHEDCGDLTDCAGQCVNLETSPAHCGGCGKACQAGRSCISGECVLTCAGGLAKCDEECVNLYTDRDHCGQCFRDCENGDLCVGGQCIPDCGAQTFCGFATGCVDLTSDNDNCGYCGNECDESWFCVHGTCELSCPEELHNCNDQCVNLDSSPVNCGQCNKVCESGICDFGDCRQQAAGHLIAIGHDFTQSHAVLRLVLGNAVFISQASPVRVLAFTQYADAAQMARVDTAITSVSTSKGRSWDKIASADPAYIVEHLLENDVLLVYRQNATKTADLRDIGSQWASVLDAFLGVGGIVVFTDSTVSSVGTYQILDAAGIFSCSGLVAANNHTALVIEPGDAVAQGVMTSYLGSSNSATFSTEDEVIVIIDKGTNRPFVVHKTYVP